MVSKVEKIKIDDDSNGNGNGNGNTTSADQDNGNEEVDNSFEDEEQVSTFATILVGNPYISSWWRSTLAWFL